MESKECVNWLEVPEVESKYRTNQVEQHQEIQQKIFELVVRYKDTTNPLSNFLVVMKKKNGLPWNTYQFMGKMSDLSEEQIDELRKEFFVYVDRHGSSRAKYTVRRSLILYDNESFKPSFYIIQGTAPDEFNRHTDNGLFQETKVETDVCSTYAEYDAIKYELYMNGFGSIEKYNVIYEDGEKLEAWYSLYDNSDDSIREPDKVSFIKLFRRIDEGAVPLIMLKQSENERVIEVDYDYSHTNIMLDRVPKDLVDKHFKVSMEIPCVINRGRFIGDISVEHKGSFLIFESIKEVQLRKLREHVISHWNMHVKEKNYYYYDIQQFEVFKESIGEFMDVHVPKFNLDFLKKNLVDFQHKQYLEFIKDINEKHDCNLRRLIISRAGKGLYHDFGPSELPKMLLAKDLYQADFSDMVTRCEAGDYDF
jgi:hypothetical protein